jgi:hypothetical protein
MDHACQEFQAGKEEDKTTISDLETGKEEDTTIISDLQLNVKTLMKEIAVANMVSGPDGINLRKVCLSHCPCQGIDTHTHTHTLTHSHSLSLSHSHTHTHTHTNGMV